MKLRLSASCRISFMMTCKSTRGMISVSLELADDFAYLNVCVLHSYLCYKGNK